MPGKKTKNNWSPWSQFSSEELRRKGFVEKTRQRIKKEKKKNSEKKLEEKELRKSRRR